jgi:hypothetical protein
MPAPVVANASDRGDTRYDTSGLQWDPARNAYVDDQGWHYDTNGLSLDRPNAYDPSKPAQNDFNEQTGTYGPGGGGGGGTPMDAYTRQLQSLLASQSQGQKADTIAAIRQALIGYGVVPQGFKDELGALDDTTRALIEKNTQTGISTYARMQQDKQDAMRQMLAGLSGKGLRRSGAKGFLGRRAQLEWDRKSADMTASLLSDIGGKTRSFADSEAERKQRMLQALFNQQNFPTMQINPQMPNPGPAPASWYQVSEPTATVPQALQSYQTAWDTHKSEPGFANYWAQNTSPVAPSGPFWGKVKVRG